MLFFYSQTNFTHSLFWHSLRLLLPFYQHVTYKIRGGEHWKAQQWKKMFPEEHQNCTQNLKTADFVSDVYDDHVVRSCVLQYLDFFFKSAFYIVRQFQRVRKFYSYWVLSSLCTRTVKKKPLKSHSQLLLSTVAFNST